MWLGSAQLEKLEPAHKPARLMWSFTGRQRRFRAISGANIGDIKLRNGCNIFWSNRRGRSFLRTFSDMFVFLRRKRRRSRSLIIISHSLLSLVLLVSVSFRFSHVALAKR